MEKHAKRAAASASARASSSSGAKASSSDSIHHPSHLPQPPYMAMGGGGGDYPFTSGTGLGLGLGQGAGGGTSVTPAAAAAAVSTLPRAVSIPRPAVFADFLQHAGQVSLSVQYAAEQWLCHPNRCHRPPSHTWHYIYPGTTLYTLALYIPSPLILSPYS